MEALHDAICAIESDDYVVIGGLMVYLLQAYYPAPEQELRATRDADIGIATIVARNRAVHRALESAGYRGVKGNLYVSKDENKEINLLVPASEHIETTGTVEIAGRGYDKTPGLGLALSAPALEVAVVVHGNTHGAKPLEFTVRVPSLEAALVMKLALRTYRKEARDLGDVLTLLKIRDTYSDELDSSWTLSSPMRGERGDAQKQAAHILRLAPRDFTRLHELKPLVHRYIARPL